MRASFNDSLEGLANYIRKRPLRQGGAKNDPQKGRL